MELIIKKTCFDKETNKQLAVGDIVILNDDERIERAVNLGLAEIIKKPVVEIEASEKPVKKRVTKKSK